MGIFNAMINGASSQFGREFGRAAANSILKGRNSYTVNNQVYTERVRPSDSEVKKAAKELYKTKFVTTNKGNITRLIDMTNLVTDRLVFNGQETIINIDEFNDMLDIYSDKMSHGISLIDSDFNDKSVDHLSLKFSELKESIDKFNLDMDTFITNKIAELEKESIDKNKVVKLAMPLMGLHYFYINKGGIGLLSILSILGILFTFTNGFTSIGNYIPFLIMPLINLLSLIEYSTMKQDDFDQMFNKMLKRYRKLKGLKIQM